jgi:hypothetical protein
VLTQILSGLAGLDTAEWIGVYGAFLATVHAGAQFIRWLQRRRGVKVKLAPKRSGTPGRQDWEDVAHITVINRRDYTVRTTSFSLVPAGLRPQRAWFLGMLHPTDIRSHDSFDQIVSIERLVPAGVDLSLRLRVVVHLSTDESFVSPAVRLAVPATRPLPSSQPPQQSEG